MINQRILMTGGTGYLGSNLVPMLLERGFEITLLKRSTSPLIRIAPYINKLALVSLDEVPLEQVFEGYVFDTILHCATNYGRKNVDPLQILEANLILPVKLLELGAKWNVKHFINTDTIIDKRISQYSLSKSQFKEWLKLYAGRIGCVNVALEHFYGPGDDESKFVSYIVNKIVKQEASIALTLGEQKRDFIYIADVVSAFETIINSIHKISSAYTDIQIGSNSLVSIKDLVKLIARLSGNDKTVLNFGALPYRPNEVMESHVDISVITSLGWKCRTPLETGIVQTIEYARKCIGGNPRDDSEKRDNT